mmetsp:Transcript_69930/g.198197  ORF Transcript_69930/g.198197 Transcript_69930/m.198197 type:complete len:327 (+) Transcript_69930:163-1143(+)
MPAPRCQEVQDVAWCGIGAGDTMVLSAFPTFTLPATRHSSILGTTAGCSGHARWQCKIRCSRCGGDGVPPRTTAPVAPRPPPRPRRPGRLPPGPSSPARAPLIGAREAAGRAESRARGRPGAGRPWLRARPAARDWARLLRFPRGGAGGLVTGRADHGHLEVLLRLELLEQPGRRAPLPVDGNDAVASPDRFCRQLRVPLRDGPLRHAGDQQRVAGGLGELQAWEAPDRRLVDEDAVLPGVPDDHAHPVLLHLLSQRGGVASLVVDLHNEVIGPHPVFDNGVIVMLLDGPGLHCLDEQRFIISPVTFDAYRRLLGLIDHQVKTVKV